MSITPQRIAFSLACFAALTSAPPASAAPPPADWYCDLTLYGLAAGMSGETTLGNTTADTNLPFGTILENLEFGAMGAVRIGRGNWAFTTDVIFMGLGASKRDITVDVDQLAIEPTLSYRLNERFEILAGARYNDIDVSISGPDVGGPGTISGGESWMDPIVGANVTVPFNQEWAFTLRADIGGSSSGLTWQAFPGVSWQFSPNGELQVGYRWIDADHESGSGANYFHYDVLSQGPQVGLRFHF